MQRKPAVALTRLYNNMARVEELSNFAQNVSKSTSDDTYFC